MDPVVNPFRPGAGRQPPVLAGRQSLVEAFDVVRRRAEELGEGDRSWVLNGLRGVGKTVLLNHFLGQVSDRGWITAKIEAGSSPSIGLALSQALGRGVRTATGKHGSSRLTTLMRVVRSFSLSVDPGGAVAVGVDVEPETGVADSGQLADDLTALFDTLGETARTLGVGVLILVDELQEARRDDLAALNQAIHHLGQAGEPWPVTVIGAGLPSLPAQLADATSYAERLWDYRSVGLLDDDASREALTGPALSRGVEWQRDALDAATTLAKGYPYFLQAVGKHVWDHAIRTPIDSTDVALGLDAARREVDDGLYRSRWERATPAQRDLLRALATLARDTTAAVSDIARSMGKARTSDLSVARNELIKKGLVYAPERGLLAFTVPGMHEFIARQS